MSDRVIDRENCDLVIATNSYGKEAAPFFTVEKTLTASVETILVSLKNVSPDKEVKIGTLSFAVNGTKPTVINIYRNALLGGTFVTHPSCPCTGLSINGTLNYTINTSTGIPIRVEQSWGTALAKEDSIRLSLLDADIPVVLQPGDIVTIAAYSANASDIILDVRFKAL